MGPIALKSLNLAFIRSRRCPQAVYGSLKPYRLTFSVPAVSLGRSSARASLLGTAVAAEADMFPPDTAEDADYELVAALSSIPTIGKAWAFPADDPEYQELSVLLSHRDFTRNTSVLTSRTLVHKDSWCLTTKATFTVDVAAVSRSPSGAAQLICRAGSPQIWEIWTACRRSSTLEVPEEVHGTVFSDGLFGHGFLWSEDERYAAYCAEDSKPKCDGNSGGSAAKTGKTFQDTVATGVLKSLEKMVTKDSQLVEDWGEKNTGKRCPKVFVLDLINKTIQKVSGQKESSTYGQPRWTPEGGLLMGGVSTGAAGSAPVDTPSDGTVAGICALVPQPALRSWQEARVSPDGSTLLFMSHEQTHSAAAAMHSAPWTGMHDAAATALRAGEHATVEHTQVVAAQEGVLTGNEFPGLYSANLNATIFPENPFIGDSIVLVNTLWRSTTAVAAVNTATGEVVRLSPPSGSFSVILNAHACVYASSSSLAQLPSLSHLRHPAQMADSADAWASVKAMAARPQGAFDPLGAPLAGIGLPPSVQSTIADVAVTRLSTVVDESSGACVESVVYRKKCLRGAATPGVLFLHGGPHSAVVDAFSGPLLALVAEGYTVVLPNYRGSSGYGEAHLAALPGHAGTMDVQDCHAALQAAISAGLVNSARVVVTGGSHGGFLTGHLIAQYPDTFRAAVMRNPVLNLPLMVHLSDIPDWCSVEVDGCAPVQGRAAEFPPSQAEQARMHAASPIARIDAVKAPVMLMLGLKDRRVPPQDGLSYAHALRSRGKAVQVHIFEDDAHPLDNPKTAFLQWPRILAFFRMHLEGEGPAAAQ